MLVRGFVCLGMILGMLGCGSSGVAVLEGEEPSVAAEDVPTLGTPTPTTTKMMTDSSASLLTTGSEVLPDVRFADLAPRRTLHVSILGNDANDGSAARPWRTLLKAARSMVAGDRTYVHAGTYYERVLIDAAAKDGTASAPIQLMAAPGETVTLRGGDGKTGPMFGFRAKSYWVLEGFKIDAAGSLAHGVRLDGSHFIVVRNNDIGYGTGPSAVPVFNGTTDIALVSNRIHDYSNAGKDSHGILIMPDSARILIRGNENFRNGGDSLQCVGPDVEAGTQVATNITIENNRFHEDRENAVDLKTCDRVTLRGNKFYGYRSTPTAKQGTAVVIHMSASRVLVEENRMWNNGSSVAIGGVLIWPTPVSDVIVRRNLIFDNVIVTSEPGDGVYVGTAKRVTIQNNTFSNMPRAAIRVGVGDRGPSEDVTVQNNLISGAVRAIDLVTAGAARFRSDRNLAYTPSTASVFRLNGAQVDLAKWRSGTAQDASSVFADPQFVASPKDNDYFVLPTSPVRDRGIATGESFCATGLDLGFLENC